MVAYILFIVFSLLSFVPGYLLIRLTSPYFYTKKDNEIVTEYDVNKLQNEIRMLPRRTR